MAEKAAKPAKKAKVDGESEILALVAKMPDPDRGICERLHAIIRANGPDLAPRTWYGMPAYANSVGKVVVFFRDTQKFKERYITLGFTEDAKLDTGAMWPTSYALKELTATEEATIAELVKKAVS